PGLLGRTFAVVVIVIGMLLLVPRPNAVHQTAVDVPAAAQAARSRLGFVPAVPQGLPEGWVPVQAQVKQDSGDTPTWHVVYIAPDGTFLGYVQAVDPPPLWENTQVVSGPETVTVPVDGNAWLLRNREDRGLTSYVLRGATVVTIVTGHSGTAELEILIAALNLPAGG
ncbi:MAG: DUF4245 domain-containing protein, partial [Kineosporiaceae bacterium]